MSRAGVTSKAQFRRRRWSAGQMRTLSTLRHAGHDADLVGLSFLNGNLMPTVAQGKIEGGRRKRHIERYPVVGSGKRLQIRADLVGGITAARHSVRSGDDQIHHAVLHEVSARIVDDEIMRHAVSAELPGGQRGSLIARSCLIHPDMHGYARVECRIHG